MTNNLSVPQNLQSMKKVLIVGCGDIGQRLARYLEHDDYKITGIRRNCPPDTLHIRYRSCDTSDYSAFKSVLEEGFNIIVITMTPAERSDAGYRQAYVQTCCYLVEALNALDLQPELIIFVSSTAVYAQDDGSWVDENSPTAPTGFSGKRLLEAEAIIHNSGFTNTVVRFSGIYGPGRNRLIEQVKQGRASASEHFTNRIHAEDCACFLAHLIKHTGSLAPVYIATDSHPTPMVDVVSWIAGKLGIKDFLSGEAVNERGNKQLNNELMRSTGYKLRYENFRQGYLEMINKN
ncbi:SDR family oxidoreductase [Cellvibrio mixtus]|uniref:SDR family oxidoreductase n=1 Tax=Cellvibrio mixtus TaxID=39650 RepID=UPI00069495B8|nr:SDR family oxidoreductase [Cellvibrio mixtus]